VIRVSRRKIYTECSDPDLNLTGWPPGQNTDMRELAVSITHILGGVELQPSELASLIDYQYHPNSLLQVTSLPQTSSLDVSFCRKTP
jgi:hypothetical protein